MLVDKVRHYLRGPLGQAMRDSAGIRAELYTLWSCALFDARLMVINAENVAEYFDTACDQYDYVLGGTAVNIAPPAHYVWVEWSPKQVRTEYYDPAHQRDKPTRIGMLLAGFPASLYREEPALLDQYPHEMLEDAAWVLHAGVVMELSRADAQRLGFVREAFDFLSQRLVCTVNAQGAVLAPALSLPPGDDTAPAEAKAWFRDQWINVTTIPFLTLSFLHSKNVTLAPQDPAPAQQRARYKAGKLPLLRYHTLHIHAPSATGGTRRPATGEPRRSVPLHIVRGHFADYRAGAGLFGKRHGLYWVPQHMRGDQAHGTVHTRYTVHAPTNEEAAV